MFIISREYYSRQGHSKSDQTATWSTHEGHGPQNVAPPPPQYCTVPTPFDPPPPSLSFLTPSTRRNDAVTAVITNPNTRLPFYTPTADSLELDFGHRLQNPVQGLAGPLRKGFLRDPDSGRVPVKEMTERQVPLRVSADDHWNTAACQGVIQSEDGMEAQA